MRKVARNVRARIGEARCLARRDARKWYGRAALVALPLLLTASGSGLSFGPDQVAGAAPTMEAPRIVVVPLADMGHESTASEDFRPASNPFAAPSVSPTSDPAPPHDATALLRYYTVKSGDSLWTVANRYHLSVATLVWANGMDDPTYLQIGQILVIPPCTGLLYSVQPGDTLDSIADHYKISAQSIVDASGLSTRLLVVGEVLMLPHAQGPPIAAAPTPTPAPAKAATRPKTSGSKTVAPKPPTGSGGTTARWGASRSYNGFSYGYCTWGAAEMFHSATGVYPGWVGDAWAWATNARAVGWTVTSVVRTRSIVVIPPWDQGAYGLGHVAWVMSVNASAGTFTVKEMNGPAGFGRWDTRTLKIESRLRYILAP